MEECKEINCVLYELHELFVEVADLGGIVCRGC